MQRRTLVTLLMALLVTWGLSSCAPGPATGVLGVASATAQPTLPATIPHTATQPPRSTPSSTPTEAPRPTLLPPSPTLPSIPPPSTTPTRLPSPSPAATALPLPPTPLAGESLPLSLGWRFDGNGHLTGAVALRREEGPLFVVASLGRSVSALSEEGKEAWRARVRGPAYALALVGGDRVAVGDDAGAVTLLDAAGRRLWRHEFGTRITALDGAWAGSLLAGGWDRQLSLLDLDRAGERLRWQVELDGPVSDIACLPELAAVATLEGSLFAVDRAGAWLWQWAAGETINRLEAVAAAPDDDLLVGVQDGRLLLLGLEDAGVSVRWQQDLGVGGPVWHLADLTGDAIPEIVVGAGGAAPSLSLLSLAGELLWQISLPSPAGAVSALDLDRDGAAEILIGQADGTIQAYDRLGRKRAAVHAGLSVWDLVDAGDGTALVLADVVAWRLEGQDGQAGGPWLIPPPLVLDGPVAIAAVATQPAGERGEAVIAFLGDVAPGRSMEEQLARYGPDYPWEEIAPLLQEADLAVANLEAVLTTQGQLRDKTYLIRAHPRWVQTLAAAGLDLVAMAHNHALDYGQVGLDETLATLQTLGVAVVGAGPSSDAKQAHRPALFSLRGVRVAVLGYAAARWDGSADVPATEHLAWGRTEAIQADVRAAQDQADLVVVLLHAGTEYAVRPSPDQAAAAHAAIDAGAALVVGHHPHVTQTVEQYKDGLIVYSLGDALFDIPRQAAMQGHLLRVHVRREGLVRAELWPFWIDGAIRPRLLADDQGGVRVQVILP